MKFEVPHRQQIASDPDSALFVRSGPFHHFLRPANAELVSGGLFLCSSTALGTRNGLLRYGIRIRCSKRPPMVRDASSEAFGVKNRRFWYGRDIRYRKRPSLVRDASSKARRTSPATSNTFSKARRTADSTDCGQPPVVRDAFSETCRAKSSLLPQRQPLQCAKRPPIGGEQT